MNNRLLALYGQMLAANARVEGMVADNQAWVAQGQSPSYGEDHFNAEASHLEELATQARQEEVAITTGPVIQGPDGLDIMLLNKKELNPVPGVSYFLGQAYFSPEFLKQNGFSAAAAHCSGKAETLAAARHMGGPISGEAVEFRLGEKPL